MENPSISLFVGIALCCCSQAALADTPPSIITEPQSQTASNTATVTLSVEISGTPPFSYQWFKDSEALSGATSEALILSNVQLDDSAHYNVEIRNTSGSVTSVVATVTVLQPVSLLWTTPAALQIHTSPAIGQGSVLYFGSDSRNLFAFGSDGSFQWRFETTNEVRSSPAIGADGTIYFGSRDRKLRALNSDGTRRWDFLADYLIDSSPAIGLNGTIYFASAGSKFYAIDTNGVQQWNFTLPGGSFSSPAVGADDTVYIGCAGEPTATNQVFTGKLYAINTNGTEKWSFAAGNSVHG